MEEHNNTSWPLPSSDMRRDITVDSTAAKVTNENTTALPSPHDVKPQDETSKTHSSPEPVMNEKMDSSSHPGLMIPEAHTNTNFNAGTNSDTFMTSNAPLTFLRRKSRFTGRYRYTLLSQTSLRNSLLPLAGFLELANAGDFAANVFNDVPVPAFAAALMGIGGCVALFFAVVAIYDAHLAWQNVCILRRERRTLHSLSSRPQYRQQSGTTNANADAEKEDLSTSTDVRTTARPRPPPPNAGLDQAQPHAFALRVYIDVNTFELGTEIIDRLMMDVTIGFGAVLV